MRIIQLIDSLEAGGAERMAVLYANALSEKVEYSGLIVSRKEGMLLNQLDQKDKYLFLDRKSTFDVRSLLKLRSHVVSNNIDLIHAHSTSFFLAFLLKLIYPKIKLIWHDHYGDSEFLNQRKSLILKITIPFFHGIVAVNEKLKNWNQNVLKFEKTICLSNFVSFDQNETSTTFLKGTTGKRIVCIANLRIQKNHFMLLEVAKTLKDSRPDWTFHLVGKDFADEYSKKIKQNIILLGLIENVFIYDSKNDIKNILGQSNIAILTSQSEGLPVAILEYGLASKAVIATKVGDIPTVIDNGSNGVLVESGKVNKFYESLIMLIDNTNLVTTFGENLKRTIDDKFSKNEVIDSYLKWVNLLK